MCIVEMSLEKSLEKFRKLLRKALTLSLERKLHNNNVIFTNYALLTLSLYVMCDVICYLHGIAVKLGMGK